MAKIKQAQEGTNAGNAIETMHDQGNLTDIGNQLEQKATNVIQTSKGEKDADSDDIVDPIMSDIADQLVDTQTLQKVHEYLLAKGNDGLTVWNQLVKELAASNVASSVYYNQVAADIAQNPKLKALMPQVIQEVESQVLNGPLGKRIEELLTIQRNNEHGIVNNRPNRALTNMSFNWSKFKKESQVNSVHSNQLTKALFISTYLDDLLGSSTKGTHTTQAGESAKQAILGMVSPAAIEEANSPLQKIQSMSPDQIEEAEPILAYVYDNWVSPSGLQTMEPVMSEKEQKEITKFNMAEHKSHKAGLNKTAQQSHFGQPYQLYGPSEKRICPKLRGKCGGYSGTGDVVSEYICRHHCLDGIVIDDNKTICGEALWRANVMDKFSREYVDENGDIVGGYLNKRFEINRNVPEENKMRLKPGEIRKPRPPEMGNIESRMQAMRQKEAQERGYRPDSNTGDPFVWNKDVDQNNVEQDIQERNKREEASGHMTIKEHGNENNPRIAKGFNLSLFKQASLSQLDVEDAATQLRDIANNGTDLTEETDVPDTAINRLKAVNTKADTAKSLGRTQMQMQASFNLSRFKTAQGDNIPLPEDGRPRQPIEYKVREDSKPPYNSKPMPTDSEDFYDRLYDPSAEDANDPPDTEIDYEPDVDRDKIDSMISWIVNFPTRESMIKALNDEIKHLSPSTPPMSTHDWDDTIDGVNEHLRRIGQPEIDINEISSYANKQTQSLSELPREFFANNNIDIKIATKPNKSDDSVDYEGEHFTSNPWAICNKSTGGKDEAGDAVFERCVQHVKGETRTSSKKETGHKKKR